MVTVYERRLLSVDDYHRMGEAGVFEPDERVELLEGELFRMMPIGMRHMACVARLNRWFSRHAADRVVVWVQNAIRLSQLSEPEPDVALLRPRDDFYSTKFPEPEDVLLVNEVADSSLSYDREFKLRLYARASIPEVWIVDLQHKRVLVFRKPVGDDYQEFGDFGANDVVSPRALPDLALAWTVIFGIA